MQSEDLCRTFASVATPKARETTRLCEIVGQVGMLSANCLANDFSIDWESRVATTPSFGASKHADAKQASRKREC